MIDIVSHIIREHSFMGNIGTGPVAAHNFARVSPNFKSVWHLSYFSKM